MNEGPPEALVAVWLESCGDELAAHAVTRQHHHGIRRRVSDHHHRPFIRPLRVSCRASPSTGRGRGDGEHRKNGGAHRAPPAPPKAQALCPVLVSILWSIELFEWYHEPHDQPPRRLRAHAAETIPHE